MSAYCSQSDLAERFGNTELGQVTDETAGSTPDAAEISKACDEATSLIDGYLATRLTLPLTTVPTIVRKWACDIARKYLWKDRAGEKHVVTLNYNDAISRLKDIANGTASLPDSAGAAAAASTPLICVTASTQIFDDTLLGTMPG